MPSKKTKMSGVCIALTSYGPDTFGTRYVQAHVGRQSDESSERGHWVSGVRDNVNGVPMHSYGTLGWRFYRTDVREARERGPRELTASVVAPSFYDLHSVDLGEADEITKALRAVSKRMQAMRDRFGYTADFAEYILRAAAVFDAEYIAIERDLFYEATGEARRDWDSEHRYCWLEVRRAREYLTMLAKIDTTARCAVCKHPIADGRERCGEHIEPLVDTAHDAINHETH